MTIGEKIAKLRAGANLSQEQLAEALSVSRQSISKWEMDQATPQCEKIVQLAEYFNVTTDELLHEGVSVKPKNAAHRGGYFDTDGFRGEAGVGLTSMDAYKVGRFLGWYYTGKQSRPGCKARIVVGKDTHYVVGQRISCCGHCRSRAHRDARKDYFCVWVYFTQYRVYPTKTVSALLYSKGDNAPFALSA